MVRGYTLSYAVRTGGFEIGLRGGHVVVRRAGWFAEMLRNWCPEWLQHFLTGKMRIPTAAASAHYSGGVLRVYRLGQLWCTFEGMDNHYVALDFVEEVHRVNR